VLGPAYHQDMGQDWAAKHERGNGCSPTADGQMGGGVGRHSRMEVRSYFPSRHHDTDYQPDQAGCSTALDEGRMEVPAPPAGVLAAMVFGSEEDQDQDQRHE
jgi:hypothetical protein